MATWYLCLWPESREQQVEGLMKTEAVFLGRGPLQKFVARSKNAHGLATAG